MNSPLWFLVLPLEKFLNITKLFKRLLKSPTVCRWTQYSEMIPSRGEAWGGCCSVGRGRIAHAFPLSQSPPNQPPSWAGFSHLDLCSRLATEETKQDQYVAFLGGYHHHYCRELVWALRDPYEVTSWDILHPSQACKVPHFPSASLHWSSNRRV